MLFEKKTQSLEIARKIIKNTGLDENLGIIQQKKHPVAAKPREFLKLVMALSTCNLVQTMKADFIIGDLKEGLRDEILLDYVKESLAKQDLIKLKGRAEVEEMRTAVMAVVNELQDFWKDGTDPQGSGPGPRYYCVKEVLKRIGGGPNLDLHDALFELMYLQHRHYINCFREILKKKPEQV